MTKKEFVDAVNAAADQEGIELTKKDTNTLLDIVFEQASEAVEDDHRFSFPNFGTFKVKYRKARKGINPQTKEPIEIPASNTVKFKPAPDLKDRVNPPEEDAGE